MNNDEKMAWLTQNAERIIIVLRDMSEVDAMLQFIELSGSGNMFRHSVEEVRRMCVRYIDRDEFAYIRPTDEGFSYGPSDSLAADTLRHIEFKDFMYGSVAKPISLMDYMEETI